MKTLFKSELGKKEILSLYDQKLKELHLDHVYKEVKTTYGITNLIISGNESRPPIILVHGSNGCAPIALETYAGLQTDFHVYAIDVLAQPNKSTESVLSMKDNSYGYWLQEVIDHLNLKSVTLAGFSFGGLIILKTLLVKESNIKEVFLSAPAFVVNGNPLVALFKVFIPMKMYMRTKNERYLEKFVNVLFTEPDSFALKFLSKVFLNFNMNFTPVPIISNKEASSISTPITLYGAKNDIFFPGKKMLKRAKKIFPSIKQCILLENSKHVQNIDDNSRIVLDIKENGQ